MCTNHMELLGAWLHCCIITWSWSHGCNPSTQYRFPLSLCPQTQSASGSHSQEWLRSACSRREECRAEDSSRAGLRCSVATDTSNAEVCFHSELHRKIAETTLYPIGSNGAMVGACRPKGGYRTRLLRTAEWNRAATERRNITFQTCTLQSSASALVLNHCASLKLASIGCGTSLITAPAMPPPASEMPSVTAIAISCDFQESSEMWKF